MTTHLVRSVLGAAAVAIACAGSTLTTTAASAATPTASADAVGPTGVVSPAPVADRSAVCPAGSVCSWSGVYYVGRKRTESPVPSGSCRKIADIFEGSSYNSGYNHTDQYVRYWEIADVHKDGSVHCLGRNRLVLPGTSSPDLRFPARGIGGL
jgi:hypothetical protein